MLHEKWNIFLEKLKVAVHKVFRDLKVEDLRKKYTHDLLVIVVRVASVSIEDAQKVITVEMISRLGSLKKAFGRDLKNIHRHLQRVHGEIIPEPQETDQGEKRNRQKKRKQNERNIENFLHDGVSHSKQTKL